MASFGSRKLWNCEMSVPDTNALPPAPRRMKTRTCGSASTFSHAASSASYIANVIALRASGRLNVRNANGGSISKMVSAVVMRLLEYLVNESDQQRRARRPARRGPYPGDGRPVLHDAARRPRRGRDQDRAAERRFDADDAGRRRHRQPELQRRQSRQA